MSARKKKTRAITAPPAAKARETTAELRARGRIPMFKNVSPADAALLTDALRKEGSRLIPPGDDVQLTSSDVVNLVAYLDGASQEILDAHALDDHAPLVEALCCIRAVREIVTGQRAKRSVTP